MAEGVFSKINLFNSLEMLKLVNQAQDQIKVLEKYKNNNTRKYAKMKKDIKQEKDVVNCVLHFVHAGCLENLEELCKYAKTKQSLVDMQWKRIKSSFQKFDEKFFNEEEGLEKLAKSLLASNDNIKRFKDIVEPKNEIDFDKAVKLNKKLLRKNKKISEEMIDEIRTALIHNEYMEKLFKKTLMESIGPIAGTFRAITEVNLPFFINISKNNVKTNKSDLSEAKLIIGDLSTSSPAFLRIKQNLEKEYEKIEKYNKEIEAFGTKLKGFFGRDAALKSKQIGELWEKVFLTI